MRINKYVARATGMSRRKVDELISKDQITVNDQPARIGQSINDDDVVKLSGNTLKIPSYTYLMLNKPVGYVCSRHVQKATKTVYELLPSKYRSLKLVGRLDKESSGLIFLTDDGDFAHAMLHPSQGKSKTYTVVLHKPLIKADIEQINKGVLLEDGVSNLELSQINGAKLTVRMQEGRNRQIRRTFLSLGYEVILLHRISIGDFELGDLAIGEFKEVKID